MLFKYFIILYLSFLLQEETKGALSQKRRFVVCGLS